jgi:hypothetical protein
MSDEKTPEFKAQYKEQYGRHGHVADYTKCAETVYSGDVFAGSKQCTRKNGHGPHGAWCKQHDPVAVKAKNEARTAKWRKEWAEKDRLRDFERGCQDAIRQIAAGHNDPRGLAQSLIDNLEAPE